ncbi:MAG: DMT family transporter [Bacteroidales bacterium]|nr:DMT family transporter [Bacteroidales bacterium]
MKTINKHILQLHLAVLCFGFAGLFGKWLNQPAIIIVLGRVLFASISLFLILLYYKQSIKLKSKRDYFYLILMGVILAVHWTTFFKSVQVSSVAIGLLTYSTFPLFITFMEPYFFKEKIRVVNILMALTVLLGIYLIVPSFDINNNSFKGVIWGIISGFTFAVLSLLNRKYVKDYSSIVVSFYQDLTATAVLLPFLFIIKPVFLFNDILLLALLGLVFTAAAHTLFINSMKSIKVQTASITSALEPVYGILFAVFLLNEIPALRTITGGILIIGAAIFVSFKKNS